MLGLARSWSWPKANIFGLGLVLATHALVLPLNTLALDLLSLGRPCTCGFVNITDVISY